jgi:hypothetical protein
MLRKVKNILTKSVKNLNCEKVSLRWLHAVPRTRPATDVAVAAENGETV